MMSTLWSIFTRMIMFVLEFLGLLKKNTSPSVEELEDHLALSIQCVQDIAKHTRRRNILSEKQCKDLSPKLLRAVENIQELVSPYKASASIIAFLPALQEFQRIVEEAKLLVEGCCRDDWVKASVFQIHNEEVFRELLLKVGLCYNVIYDKAKTMSLASGRVLKVEDLRSLPPDSTFRPALREDVLDDQQTLQRRLEEVTKNVRNSNDVILARYLLSRLTAPSMSEERSLEDSCIMYDAFTCKVADTDLKGTWDKSIEPIKGGNASCVSCTKWLGIDCAKKVIFFGEGDLGYPVFRKEAAILASVNHPNIVKFFCCGISTEGHEKQGFIGMELMERSLSNLIEERRKAGRSFPTHVALDIILQIARGMLYMHEFGTAHRDLKPQNVGVSKAPNGTFCVKLLDFGLSKTKVQASKSQTVSYSSTGTTIYRAPEAFEDAKAENRKQKVKWFRADVFSFAVTCCQILTLQEPYASVKATAVYKELMKDTRPTLPADCPKTLSNLIKECWAGDPNARPNFWSICERLEKFKHDLLLQGPGGASTKGVGQLRGENVVASSSSYAYIETMLKRRSELRTPAKHLAQVVENEGATSAPMKATSVKVMKAMMPQSVKGMKARSVKVVMAPSLQPRRRARRVQRDQLRGENVASSSSYAHIETMLKQRSELRTPAKHLAKVVENEGATSDCDEGHICEGDEGDDAAISEGDEGAISEGGDVAISTGADEMKNASQRINGGTQPSKNDLSKVLGDADQATKENVNKEAGKQPLEGSGVRRDADRGRGEEYSKIDSEGVERSRTNRESRGLRKRVLRAGCEVGAYLLVRKATRHLCRVSREGLQQ